MTDVEREGNTLPAEQKVMSRMTIEDAKKVFEKFGTSLLPDLEAMVTLFRENRIDAPLSNNNYLHALSMTDFMMANTSSSFLMVTGGDGDGFLGCLQDQFDSMLKRIQKANATAKIIILGSQSTGTDILVPMERKYPEALNVIRLHAKGSVMPHFIVCDDDMVRDEEIHETLNKDQDANLIKAKVYFRNKPVAKVFIQRFEMIWNILSEK